MTRRRTLIGSFPVKAVILHVAFQISSATVLIMYLESNWRREAVQAEKVRLTAEGDVLDAVVKGAGAHGLRVLGEMSGRSAAPFSTLVMDRSGRKVGGSMPLVGGLPTDIRSGVTRLIVDPRSGTVILVRPLAAGNWLFLRGGIDFEKHRRTLVMALLGAILLGIDAAVVAAVLQARSMNRRVREIADVTDEVQIGKLDRRVPRTFNKDAFDRLGAALNTMFAGIERSVGQMRAMTDALAHDLRSPMMRIRVRIEELCELPLPSEARVNVERVIEEMDAVVSMLQSALEITRAEAGVARTQFMLLDLAPLVMDIVDNYQVVTHSGSVRLTAEIDGTPVIIGHKQLLAQLISNLIDNALSYGAAGGVVHLVVRQDAKGVVVQVMDRGPGIAPGDREIALSRFGRLDAARGASGAGLGLALVQSICHLHSGTVELLDAAPGLLVEVRLPRGGQAG